MSREVILRNYLDFGLVDAKYYNKMVSKWMEEIKNIKKKLLKGGPFADPFIIAKAKVNNAAVVSQEKHKENTAKIPNICKHFNIECIDLEGFLIKENWKF